MKVEFCSSTKLRGVATKGRLLVMESWIELETSSTRRPNARAAASDAGRFVVRDEMIFLRDL